MGSKIYKQWDMVKAHIDYADIAFVIIRALILWGLAGWLAFSPVPNETIGYVISLIIFFVVYSMFVYIFLVYLIQKKRIIYKLSLFFDFLFTLLLVRATGGFESAFSNGFYLMTGLYSFYFGPVVGIGIASVAAVLYCVGGSFDFGRWSWPDISVRVAFLYLLALPLGMLSEKLRNDKEEIEILKRDLEKYVDELKKERGDL